MTVRSLPHLDFELLYVNETPDWNRTLGLRRPAASGQASTCLTLLDVGCGDAGPLLMLPLSHRMRLGARECSRPPLPRTGDPRPRRPRR